MFRYSAVQWVFFFYLYCFLGWCFESAYVSLRTRKLTNRGFMRGPFLPIYGSGAIMMLVVSMPFQDNIVLTYLAGCVGATALELFTGMAMEAIFKVRYWDYSYKRFQYKGHICLSSTIAWGGFTILMTEVIQVNVEKLVLMIPDRLLTIVTFLLTAIIFSDFAVSFKAAIDLRDMLVKMEQAREELLLIRKHLEELAANTGEEVHLKREEIRGNLTEVKDHIEELFIKAKENALLKTDSFREELAELRTKFAVASEIASRLTNIKGKVQQHILANNPITSKRFAEFIEELKKKASDKNEEE